VRDGKSSRRQCRTTRTTIINWNKNWNNQAYVRNWNHSNYYGQFVGGIVLGTLLAASGAGIVPYAPQPNLCWYWADPYMIRGYWDYCY
jgi:hypothetical protein